MRSKTAGKDTLAVEVLNISKHGFWLLVSDREYFLSFDDFPWFRDANIGAILDVRLPHPGHLHWPKLDVDLELRSIESPAEYPLVDRSPVKSSSTAKAASRRR